MLTRLATHQDVAAAAALVQQYWQFERIEGFDRPRVSSLLRDLVDHPERGALWLAEQGHRLNGYLLAAYVFSLEHGGMMGEIDEFYVEPAARSAGTGALLLAHAQRDMATRGLIRLQLQLGVDNQRGRAFYDRHGFHARAGYAFLDKAL